ncbi:extracellular solute-binding protein [Patescibacteria group bacterium]|nr:extracellular solute-binding protein [Patescibacteria group bacterium]
MDDSTIFRENQEQSSLNTSSDQNIPPSPPPVESSPLAPPTDYSEGSGSKLMTIIKILIGLFVAILIIGLIYFLVLPRFAPKKAEKVTLTYWGLWEDQRIMDSVLSDFEKSNPNITVEYSKQDPKQYADRLKTRIENGNGPDVFKFHNTWYPILSSYLLPIPSDSISAKDFKEWYYPVMQKDLIKNGVVYGIPLGIDTLALYINEDLFKAAGLNPPVTWEDFASMSAVLTVKDEAGKIRTAGAAMGSFDNITHAPDIISLLFVQSGVNPADIPAKKTKVSEALSFYTSFATGDNDSVWDNTLDNSTRAFAAGTVGMYFGYSWDYFTIKAMNPNLKFKIVSVPQLSNQNKTIASYWAEGASTKGKHQKEAFLLLKFLAQKSTEEKLYAEQSKTRFFGEPYARADLADKLKDNPIAYPFVLGAKNSTSSFFADSTYEASYNGAMNEYLKGAVNSVIVQRTSPDTAVDTLIKGVTQVLGKYGQ